MDDAQLLRARRRYRTLLREARELEQKGQRDEQLTLELLKLEQEHPSLKEIKGSAGKELNTEVCNSQSSNIINKSLHASEISPPLSTLLSNPLSANVNPVVGERRSPLLREKRKNDSLMNLDNSYTLDQANHGDDMNENVKQGIFSAFNGSIALVYCALSLWSEVHLPTSFNLTSYLEIVGVAISIAITHRYFVDPDSPIGIALCPVLFASFVHINRLFTIYVKRAERVTMAMFLVYFLFDILPSMVLVFVIYTLTTNALELL